MQSNIPARPFREDCLKPFKDEDEDNDDVV